MKLFTLLLLQISLLSCQPKHLNVLILGNSITYHSPNSELGWTGNWGMAASAADKDFESILTKRLQDSTDYKISVTAKNIAEWEKDFSHDLNKYPEIAKKNYDLLIIRLGENVDEKAPGFSNYEKALNDLINHFKGTNTKVIITGTVWQSPQKDKIQENIAKTNQYTYIPLLSFQANPNNYATGKFANEGVSAHPSDTGMANLAEILYNQIKTIYEIP